MSGSLEINGKKLSSLSSALKHSSYSRDYITRLAREQKIVASQVGRQWYIDLDSLKKYEEAILVEQKIRKQKLSEERRRERSQKISESRKNYSAASQSRRVKTNTALASAVLFVGVLVGVLFQQNFITTPDSSRQVANTSSVDSGKVTYDDTIATNDPATEFSNESVSVTTFSEGGQGILLMPQVMTTGTAEVNPTERFSDEVSIVTDEDGQAFIVKKDGSGKEIERIPYIVVPVNKNNEKTL